MTGDELREAFLRYFERRGHTRVRSSPLVPGDDPTLLFTNAGMVQFKSVFLGEERRDYARATTCQKCVRAGGKHNDLENVGGAAGPPIARAEVAAGRPCLGPACECDRWLEVWNLVFMQFNRDAGGTLTPLPRPSIDTGMGLERVTAVVQGKQSNFDTDLLAPLLDRIAALARTPYRAREEDDVSMRVVADH